MYIVYLIYYTHTSCTMNNAYIYLSSLDFSNIHPENKANNFTIVLPQKLQLSGVWSLGLLDIDINIKTGRMSQIFVVCDIVNNSYVGNQLHRVLRRVTVTSDIDTYTFSAPQYVTVENTCDIQAINITILDCDTMLPSLLPLGKVNCTLHLKRDRPPLLI